MACSGLFIGPYQVYQREYGKYLIVSFVLAMGISDGSTVFRHRLDYHRCFGKIAIIATIENAILLPRPGYHVIPFSFYSFFLTINLSFSSKKTSKQACL